MGKNNLKSPSIVISRNQIYEAANSVIYYQKIGLYMLPICEQTFNETEICLVEKAVDRVEKASGIPN